MRCPMDPFELNSHVVILHNVMWVIELKLQRSKGYFLICFASISTCLILQISYNPIHNGRPSQGAFFFRYSLAVNPVEMWYATSYMTSTSKENFGRTWRDFSTLNTSMNVPDGEAY